MSTRINNNPEKVQVTLDYFRNSKALLIGVAMVKDNNTVFAIVEKNDFLTLFEKYQNAVCRNGKTALEFEKLQYSTDKRKRCRNIQMKAFCESIERVSQYGLIEFEYKAENGEDLEKAIAKALHGYRTGQLPNHTADIWVNGIGIESKGYGARLSRH